MLEFVDFEGTDVNEDRQIAKRILSNIETLIGNTSQLGFYDIRIKSLELRGKIQLLENPNLYEKAISISDIPDLGKGVTYTKELFTNSLVDMKNSITTTYFDGGVAI